MIEELIKISNDLDNLGLVKEADCLDRIIIKHAWELTSPSTWGWGEEDAKPTASKLDVYTVVKGDTVSRIAQSKKTTVKAIQEANPGMDINKIKVGQKIKIPGTTAPTPKPSAPEADERSYLERATDYVGLTGDDEPEPAVDAGPLPFKSRTEGDDFRIWVREKYPAYKTKVPGKPEGLSPSGPHDNPYMRIAWKNYGAEYKQAIAAGSEKGVVERLTEWTGIPGALEDAGSMGDIEVKRTPGGDVIIPFSTPGEGDAFRQWVHREHPDVARKYNLSKTGPKSNGWNNSHIRKAWGEVGSEYLGETATTWDRAKLIGGKAVSAAMQPLITEVEKVARMGGIELHLRGFASFLAGKTDTWTNRHFLPGELQSIKELVLYRLTNEGHRQSFNTPKTECPGCLINYETSGQMQDKQGWERGKIMRGDKGGDFMSMFNKNKYDQISTFIGSSDIGSGSNTPENIAILRQKFRKGEAFSVTVEDVYDFSGKYSDKLDEFSRAVSKVLGSNKVAYQKVRDLAQWRHGTGYKGFPVIAKINISKADIEKFKQV